MKPTLYASFTDPNFAEKAAGALLDHGVNAEDISIVVHPTAEQRFQGPSGPGYEGASSIMYDTGTGGGAWDPLNNKLKSDSQGTGGVVGLTTDPMVDEYMDKRKREADSANASASTATAAAPNHEGDVGVEPPKVAPTHEKDRVSSYDIDHAAKAGVTTTTLADAESGAATGAEIGLGLGTLAALAAITVPGFGLVVGGGALATALAGMAASAGAGAIAGGVTGFLKDQGVPTEVIPHLVEGYEKGGAILAVTIRDEGVDQNKAQALLHKYGASKVGTYNAYMG